MVFNIVTSLVVVVGPQNLLSKQKSRMILLKSNAIAKQIMLQQIIQDLKSIDAPSTVKIASVQLIPRL
jgi:hypothetical protein